MQHTVTVIMAVYNAADYLKKSLDSLLEQRYQSLDIICVDDCSTDGSMRILNDYARRDGRIRVLSTPRNSGPAVARNMAIDVMKGSLTAFLDADDWLSSDAIEKAVEVFDKHPLTDCVLFRCIHHYPDNSERPYPLPPFESKSGYEAFVDSLDWTIHGIYIARSSMYRRYPFDTACRTFSDDNTTRVHYYISREVRCCEGTYYYRYNPQSISNNRTVARMDYLRANESMKRQLTELKVNDDILNKYEKIRWLVVVDSYMFYYMNRKRFSPRECFLCISEIKRIWQGIEYQRLPLSLRLKFGYKPFRYSWILFCLQEELYFTLKKLTCRLK